MLHNSPFLFFLLLLSPYSSTYIPLYVEDSKTRILYSEFIYVTYPVRMEIKNLTAEENMQMFEMRREILCYSILLSFPPFIFVIALSTRYWKCICLWFNKPSISRVPFSESISIYILWEGNFQSVYPSVLLFRCHLDLGWNGNISLGKTQFRIIQYEKMQSLITLILATEKLRLDRLDKQSKSFLVNALTVDLALKKKSSVEKILKLVKNSFIWIFLN